MQVRGRWCRGDEVWKKRCENRGSGCAILSVVVVVVVLDVEDEVLALHVHGREGSLA